MANKTKQHADGIEELDVITDTAEIKKETGTFLQKNAKLLIGITAAILLSILGYFGYQKFIAEPNEEKANNSIYTAEQYFGVDSFNLALNGDGQRDGFLKTIKKYGSTAAGNRAKYFAGMTYLKMGNPKEAIKHLEDFDGKGTEFEIAAQGNLGTAYWDNGNTAKAAEYYEKAIKSDDATFTPMFLLNYALLKHETNKNDEAISLLKRIKNEFPQSMQMNDVDKYLAMMGDLSAE